MTLLFAVLYIWWSVLRRVWTEKANHWTLLAVLMADPMHDIFYSKNGEMFTALLFTIPFVCIVFAVGWRGIAKPAAPAASAGHT